MIIKKILFWIFLFVINISAFSQNKQSDYEQFYYVSISGTHPQQIIELGSNWEIIEAFKDAGNLSKLDELRIEYTMKQIEVLVALNLLKFENNIYRSKITILNKLEIEEIQLIAKDIALNIVKNIKKDFLVLNKNIIEKEYSKNTYTIFFSYIMDNLVWNLLEKNKILPENNLTAETPIWSGTIWFNITKRDFMCGTNSTVDSNYIFATNFTGNSPLNSVIIEKSTILKEIILNSKIEDIGLRDSLVPYGICDIQGNLKIPFISKETTPEIYKTSNLISQQIYDYIVNRIDYSEFETKYNMQSKGDAIIIIYHDIMWQILDVLENENLLTKPIAFSNPNMAKKNDLKDLLLIYKE